MDSLAWDYCCFSMNLMRNFDWCVMCASCPFGRVFVAVVLPHHCHLCAIVDRRDHRLIEEVEKPTLEPRRQLVWRDNLRPLRNRYHRKMRIWKGAFDVLPARVLWMCHRVGCSVLICDGVVRRRTRDRHLLKIFGHWRGWMMRFGRLDRFRRGRLGDGRSLWP
jgi:hypothetical protein